MNAKIDYNIEHLLDFNDLYKFFNNSYNLLNCHIFTADFEGNIPNYVEEYLNTNFNNFSYIKNGLINSCKTVASKQIDTDYLITSKSTGYQFFFKPITIYSNHAGYFGVIFPPGKRNIKKANSIYEMFLEISRLNYESTDLIKDNITHYKEMSLLSQVSEGSLNANSIEEIYRRTLEITLQVVRGKTGLIFSYAEKTGVLELVHIIPQLENRNQSFALLMDDNIFSLSVKGVKSVILNNVNDDETFIHPLPFLSPDNYLLVPLSVKRKALGLIAICDKVDSSEFTSKEKKLLKTIANQAAVTIENLSLFFQLKENFISTIEALAAVIDMKDKSTVGHSKRVREISIAIADELEIYDTKFREDIQIGALLHDIGKIGIPSEILFKPTAPNQSEWEIIRKHPENGVEIVKNLSGFDGIIPAIKYHHERWDGSGYPENLKGENIPLITRIISVADAYDTIISRRPYKKPFTHEAAVEAIEQSANAQFDPDIVKAFINAYKKGKILKIGEV